MSDLDSKSDGEAGAKTQSQPHEVPEEPVYLHTAAGLRGRKGRVPLWLWFVVVALAVWGMYYLMTYWNPPSSRQ